MTIIATAHVPTHSRLTDARTVELPTFAGQHIDLVETRSPLCPPWCTGGCKAVEHFVNGADAYHYRGITEMTVRHGDIIDAQRWIDVEMEASEDRDGIEPATIRMSTCDPSSNQANDSVALTVEQAEELGRALLEAARLARRDAR